VFTLVGLIPEVGSVIKSLSRAVIRGVREAISHLPDILRWARHLLRIDVADIDRFRRYIMENWPQWMRFGQQIWDQILSRGQELVGRLPRALRGYRDVILTRFSDLRRISSHWLSSAFERVRAAIDRALTAVRERLRPGRTETPSARVGEGAGEAATGEAAQVTTHAPTTASVTPEGGATAAPTPAPQPPTRRRRLTRAQRNLRAQYIGLVRGIARRVDGTQNIYRTNDGFLIGPYRELRDFLSNPANRSTLGLASERLDVHHLVEMRHLRRTRGAGGRFNYDNAPCVVLTEEFHRRRPPGEGRGVAGWISGRESRQELGLRRERGREHVQLEPRDVFELYSELYSAMPTLSTLARRILGLRG
jgi:hypothetical protein